MNKFYSQKSFVYAPLTLALGLSSPLMALASDSQELDPLVVTAQRISQPLSQTLAATTVITRADIERLQPSSLADLLQGQAGVEIGRNAGKMGITSIFMRGTNSNHTLILLDGQKINDPTSGGSSLQFIPVAQIQRVEIVRGPQSSAWGADALGGVINIITTGATRQALTGRIQQQLGGDNTSTIIGELRGGTASTRLNLGLQLEQSEGFNAQTADTTDEEDGYEHHSLNLGLEQDLGKQHLLGFKLLHTRGENEYDGCANAATFASSNACLQEFAMTTMQGRWRAELNKNWAMALTANRTEEHREDHFESADNGEIQTRRDSLNLEHRFHYDNYSAGVGADAHREKLLKAEGFDKTQRDIYGFYAQGNFELVDALTLALGVRYDDDEFFGNHTTANSALAWNFASNYQAGASVSSGYRAPNLQELYKPAWGGNPALEPEESINLETWIGYHHSQGARIRTTFFQKEIDNLIVSDSSYKLQNLNEVRIRGLEIDAHYRLENWQLGLALTLQNPENQETGQSLLRRSQQHGRLTLDYLAESWGLGGSFQGQGERSDWDKDLPGYALINLRGHYAFNANWRLEGKVDNVLDKDYEPVSGYTTAGLYPEVSLRLDF